MSFAVAENTQLKVQSVKLLFKVWHLVCDAVVVVSPTDATYLFDLDEDAEFSVTSLSYCHYLLLWMAETHGLDPIRIHRLLLFSKSVQFTPSTLPKTKQPACEKMEAAGVWKSVGLS